MKKKNQIYQPIHPNTDLPHPTRDQEDLLLLIFVKMSHNKTAKCPKICTTFSITWACYQSLQTHCFK